MKKRYTEEQIIKAIKQNEAGAKVGDICRDLGISSATFYNWRLNLQVWKLMKLSVYESLKQKIIS